MKKLFFIMLLFISMVANAQQDVTKFLGISIDGFKPAMIQKLKAKGFRYNQQNDYFTGEFNGSNVQLRIATNNNKVWRIFIKDEILQDETGIKIRFNKLVRQFLKNKKYLSFSVNDQTIPDSEDISYEISVNSKRYEATFYQQPTRIDSLELGKKIRTKLLEKYTAEQIDSPTEEEKTEINEEVFVIMYNLLYVNRPVWFMIDEEGYEKYRILMYYDNEHNRSDGEDL